MKPAAALYSFVMFLAMEQSALALDVRFRCEDGTHMSVAFSNSSDGGSAVLALGNGEGRITLPQVQSADGGRYAAQDTEFWVKGRGATFTRAGKSTTCHVISP